VNAEVSPGGSASPDFTALMRARTGGGDPLAVLLVEDSPLLAERLRESIEPMPEVGRVRTVDREAAAIAALAEGVTWDFVVLDLHLRQGSGFGVLRAAAAKDGGRPVFVVFTNHDVPGYRSRAAALGARHFLDKARDFDRLGDLLREAFADASGPRLTA
jgi:two-component system chemotaxis response regulator CheY